jgi:hypothetical protein
MCGKFRISHQCAIRFESLGRNAFLLDVSHKAIFVIRDGRQGIPLYPEESPWQSGWFRR